MNYLWEAMLQAMDQGIPENKIRFQMAKRYSPYMELSHLCLNQDKLEEDGIVEINPYFRFYDIFKNLYDTEMKEFHELRDSLTNLIFHLIAQNDLLSGMTRTEYLKKLLYQDIQGLVYGSMNREALSCFTREERERILSGILRQHETGSSLDLFREMAGTLISNIIIYHNNEDPHEILIYIGHKKEKRMEEKVNFLIGMFLEIPYCVELYYEHHFGIIGVEETMMTEEIILC